MYSAIARMKLGGTLLPIRAHCSPNEPVNWNLSGNDPSRFSSLIVGRRCQGVDYG